MSKKQDQLEKAQTVKDVLEVKNIYMNSFILAEYIKQIVDMTHGKIDDQKVLRDIIDFQYKKSKQFMTINLIILAFGYLIPLIVQMKSEDPVEVRMCNFCCFIVQIYCLLYELISLKADGFINYFSSVWNLVDVFTMFLYFIYF